MPRHLTYLLLLPALLIAAALPAWGQSKPELIRAIQKEFRAINADTGMRQKTLENEDFLEQGTDGGGALTGYFRQGRVRKIRQWIGLSTGNELKELYFLEGQLIFVYEQFHAFVFDPGKGEIDRTRTETIFEGRYYFHEQQLIDRVTTGHKPLGDDRMDPQKTLLAEAAADLKLLQAR